MDRPPQPTLPQVDPLHPLTSLEWRECGEIPPFSLDITEAVVVGNKVYMGRCVNTTLICIHDLITEEWRTIKSPRSGSALTTYQERLVLVGGMDPSTATPTNQLWVMEEEGTWTQPLPPMPTPRTWPSAATIQNNLIVAGGAASQGLLDVVEVYNGRQWMTAQSLPRACSDMKSAIHNGIWYLLGGYGQDKKVFCASLESLVASTQSEVTETVWKTLPEVSHHRSTTAVQGGRLMAIDGIPSDSDVLSYSPHTQSWVKVGDLPDGLWSTCATVLPTGELLVVAGWGSGRIFKGLLRADQFQPATSFNIAYLERLEKCTGINIFREVAPKYQWLVGSILLHANLAKKAILIQSPVERSRFIFKQWLSGKSHLHRSATWEMLFKVLRDMELGWLAQKMEDWLRMVPGRAVVGPDHSRGEGEGRLEQGEGGVEEVEGKEQEGGSEEDTKPGAGVKQEVGVAKREGGAEKEPLKMKQEQGVLEERVAKGEKQLLQCEETIQIYKERVAKREEQLLQCEETIQMFKERVAKREEQLLQCEETIQMYKERHQKLIQQMESVMAENEQLKEQIRPVEEGALVPAGESTTGYLHGVDVIGETTLSVTNEAQTFHWAGYGLKLHIPPASLPAGVGQSSIDIKASLAGQFQFPENTTLVSAVYWLHCEVRFATPLTVEIQHCGKHRGGLSFVRTKCSQRDLPYQFKPLSSRGVFSPRHCYGSVTLSSFSGLGVTQEGSEEQMYCAQLYYLGSRIDWRVRFVITKDLEAFIKVVRHAYREMGAIEGPDQDIEFEEDKITLEISERDLGGWSILTVTPPTIIKKKVDSYESGHRIPSCQLQVVWTKDQPPVVIRQRVTLHGAKEPLNFITIQSDPLPQVSEGPAPQPTAARSEDPGVSRRRQHTSEEEESPPKRPKLSEDLALKYPAGMESEPELSDLMDQIATHIPNKWRGIGIALGLTINELDIFSLAYGDPYRCFSSVFALWKSRMTREPYSWGTVVQALRTPAVGEMRLAAQLEDRLTQQK